MSDESQIRIGIDTGGTFTDVVAIDEATGTAVTTKTPSTPEDPAQAFLAGISKALDMVDVRGESVSAVSHGTTVATNQLLEGNIERLGFITNAGYESVLEIARQSVPDSYGNSYFWVKPERIVPRHLAKGVTGRLDFTGDEITPFDAAHARELARWFKEQNVNTLGICLMHAYANPAHEQRMRQILAEEHPEATVSVSSQVLREYREYERSMTTLVDAAVKPSLARYIGNIKSRLDEFDTSLDTSLDASLDTGLPFYVMKSNGGVLSADEVVHQPISTVLSGPAAGALGAAMIAKIAGFDRVLTCDGGGTSTDVSVVVDGEPTLTTEGSVGVFPSKIPMIDVVTVGAGGGSIAGLSPEGTLKVGPASAGADPGPVCYGNGGADVTITDAHVVLGRIPTHLLGGEMGLDAAGARTAVDRLAGSLGVSARVSAEKCAAGILEISAWNQANALRQISVTRGLDVRDFALTTFGGSGSLLLCRLMDILDIPAVLIPQNPGNLSAFGLLTVDVKNDYVQTNITLHESLDPERLSTVYDDLTARASEALTGEGFPGDVHQFARTADLRYFGQAFEVRVPVDDGPITAESADMVTQRFHDEHRGLYGYDFAGDPDQHVEWVNLRVTGIGPIRRPDVPVEPLHRDPCPRETAHRPICFDPADGFTDTPVYWREDLVPGTELAGPAVIEEYGSTVPIHPGFAVRIDEYRNIIVRRSGAPA